MELNKTNGAAQITVSEHISIFEKIAYSFGDTAANITWRAVTTFLLIFYTDVYGLKPEDAAFVLLVTRLFDGITDVIMGMICDRTNYHGNKFRPWILWSAIPFGLILIATFTVPDLSYNGKLVYALVTYCTLTLVYTINNVPYSSLMSAMTSDPKERTSISSFRFAGAYFGGLISQVGLIYLVAYFGGGRNASGEVINKAAGYQHSMYLLGALMVVFLLCTYFGTKERIHTPTSASGAKGVISDLKELVTNKPWWILLFTAFLYCTYNNIKQSMAAYFIGKYVPDADGNYLALYMACLLIVSVLASLLVSPLARRYGKKSTFIAAMLFSGVATISLYFVPSTNIQGVFAGGILSEAGAAMLSPLFFAMLGDAADYSQYKCGHRAAGLIYSAGTLSMKFGGGAAGFIIGTVLAAHGYDASHLTSDSIIGIRELFSIIPGVFIILSSALVFFYPLGKQKMEAIAITLKERALKEEQSASIE